MDGRNEVGSSLVIRVPWRRGAAADWVSDSTAATEACCTIDGLQMYRPNEEGSKATICSFHAQDEIP